MNLSLSGDPLTSASHPNGISTKFSYWEFALSLVMAIKHVTVFHLLRNQTRRPRVGTTFPRAPFTITLVSIMSSLYAQTKQPRHATAQNIQ